MTTMLPLDEGLLALPRLTGIVRTTWSCCVTVIVWVALSVVITSLAPIDAWIVTSSEP